MQRLDIADATTAVTATANPDNTMPIYLQSTGIALQDIFPPKELADELRQTSQNIFVTASGMSVGETYPEAGLLLDDIVVPSKLKNPDGTIRVRDLVTFFNANVTKSAFTMSTMKMPFRDSWYLNPGEVLLGHRNKVPELALFNKDKFILRDISRPVDTTEVAGQLKITEPFYGMHGSYVLNVPIGKYAVAMSGNIPQIFDTGPHVVHDPNFMFSPEAGFVDKTAPYINHSSMHIVRVPLGKFAKIWINNKPYLLPARQEPYVFNHPLFKIEQTDNNYFFDANANWIQHGTIAVIRVPIGQIAKIWFNNKPLLLPARQEPYVFNDPQLKHLGNDTFIDATANVIQHGAIKIIRVPVGKFAKIRVNNVPYLLESRAEPYIFNDPMLKIENNNNEAFFDATANMIQHGNIHVIRVPVGKIAKIWLNNKPYLLTARNEPYVFNDPLFRIESNNNDYFFDASANAIHHNTIHIIRVPVGKVAKIWLNNKPILLEASPDPYIYNDPLFRIEKNGDDHLFDSTDNVISHGSKHIVRVPSGKLAKVWFNNQPLLLEARPEPYVYEGPMFRIDMNGRDYFFDATAKLIIHGSIKRIMPHTGEVAISYNSGSLEVIEPKPDNTPIRIESPTHEVSGFLEIGVRTLVFPSEDTKKMRLAESSNLKPNADEVNMEIFTTKDSLRVGVKLLVSFMITKPAKALSVLLNDDGILKHVENLATVDMGKAIQQCSSQEFLCFYQTRPSKNDRLPGDAQQDQPKPPMSFQDTVKEQLSKDLAEFGIELVRLNIETPKIIDTDLAKKMSEQAQQTAATSAQEAVMEQQYRIAQRTAQKEAETRRIAQDQENQAKISKAQAELDAARLSAEAMTVKAEADKRATILRAEGEKQAAILLGEQYKENSYLFELKKLEYQTSAYSKALEKIQPLSQLPPGMLGGNGVYSLPFAFFNPASQQAQRTQELEVSRTLPNGMGIGK